MSLMRGKEHDAIPCSVSKEFLEYAANLHPEVFIKNGEINIPKVLFMLGFKIDFDRPDNGYYIMHDRIIRSKSRPYMTYKTTVYNGNVRQELKAWLIDPITGKGKPVYDNTMIHFMAKAYSEVEVLTIEDICDDVLTCIDDVGDHRIYAEGMANVDKRVDVDKPFRIIVR